MSTPDYRPLDDDELAALEFFVDSALPKGMPSMVRRLILEVRDKRASPRVDPGKALHHYAGLLDQMG